MYYNFVTGELYTGPFPDPVVDYRPVRRHGLMAYEKVTVGSSEPGYKSVLDRYMFIHHQIQFYEKQPEWVVG